MGTQLISHAARRLYERGRAIWPQIDLDFATFENVITQRWGDRAFDATRAGDLYLTIACAERLDPAILAFEGHYLSGLVSMLVRRGHDAATAADAVQELRVRFLVGDAGRGPRIAEYDGRGALMTWLKVAAMRIALSAHRRRRRETNDDVDIIATERGPELDLLRQRFGAEFNAAFRSTFEALTPRERTLLRYQVIDRLGIDRIAAIYGVHRATAARWVAHARETLVDGIRCALQARLDIGRDELDSLLRVLQSKLELSLRLLLTPSLECEPGNTPSP